MVQEKVGYERGIYEFKGSLNPAVYDFLTASDLIKTETVEDPDTFTTKKIKVKANLDNVDFHLVGVIPTAKIVKVIRGYKSEDYYVFHPFDEEPVVFKIGEKQVSNEEDIKKLYTTTYEKNEFSIKKVEKPQEVIISEGKTLTELSQIFQQIKENIDNEKERYKEETIEVIKNINTIYGFIRALPKLIGNDSDFKNDIELVYGIELTEEGLPKIKVNLAQAVKLTDRGITNLDGKTKVVYNNLDRILVLKSGDEIFVYEMERGRKIEPYIVLKELYETKKYPFYKSLVATVGKVANFIDKLKKEQINSLIERLNNLEKWYGNEVSEEDKSYLELLKTAVEKKDTEIIKSVINEVRKKQKEMLKTTLAKKLQKELETTIFKKTEDGKRFVASSLMFRKMPFKFDYGLEVKNYDPNKILIKVVHFVRTPKVSKDNNLVVVPIPVGISVLEKDLKNNKTILHKATYISEVLPYELMDTIGKEIFNWIKKGLHQQDVEEFKKAGLFILRTFLNDNTSLHKDAKAYFTTIVQGLIKKAEKEKKIGLTPIAKDFMDKYSILEKDRERIRKLNIDPKTKKVKNLEFYVKNLLKPIQEVNLLNIAKQQLAEKAEINKTSYYEELKTFIEKAKEIEKKGANSKIEEKIVKIKNLLETDRRAKQIVKTFREVATGALMYPEQIKDISKQQTQEVNIEAEDLKDIFEYLPSKVVSKDISEGEAEEQEIFNKLFEKQQKRDSGKNDYIDNDDIEKLLDNFNL